jgi:hypothetical protein
MIPSTDRMLAELARQTALPRDLELAQTPVSPSLPA